VERLLAFLDIARQTGRCLVIQPRDAYLLSAMRPAEPGTVPDLAAEPSPALYDDPKSRQNKWEEVTRQAHHERVVGPDWIRKQPGDYILVCSLWDMADLLEKLPGGVYIYSNSKAYDKEQKVDLAQQVNPNGTVTEATYDRANRLRSLVNRRVDGTVIAAFTYEVNGVGLRTVMTATYGWRNPPVVVEHYAYDPLRRLIGVTDREGFQAVYEYDASGNRTRWWANDDQTTQRPGDGFEVTYTYDAADRLLEAVRVSGPPEGTQRYVYAYDANGNRVNLNWPGPPGPNTQGIDYAYDREDRLILAQAYQTNHRGHRVDREVTRLYYDGLGRRLAKEYDPKDGSGGVKRTEYVFDGLDPVVEYSLWNGQRAEYYRGGLESFSPTPMLLEMRDFPAGSDGEAYWYHLDGRGSVAGLTKHQGQSTHNYRYDAYGQVLPAQGNWTDLHNPYTFLGKEWDEHLGLYEFGFRLYDPWAGVWLTREPLPGRTIGARNLAPVWNAPRSRSGLGELIWRSDRLLFFP